MIAIFGLAEASVAWIFSSSISEKSRTLEAFTPRRLARSAICCADSSPVT